MKHLSLLITFFLCCMTSVQALTKLPLADPFVLCHDNQYYAYGTSDANGIVVYTSADLKFWTKAPDLALHKNDSYADGRFWAPEVYCINGQFYMYYSADEHICVATAASPIGPFVQDVQLPMLEEKAIDNSLFIDDDGKPYLFFVRFTNGNAIWMAELENDYKTIKTGTMRLCLDVSQTWEKDLGQINEGPFCVKHNGYYYLTYSANDYRSRNYGVGYAYTADIADNWIKYGWNPVLRKPNGLFGTGHHCLFRDKDNQLKMAFHAHKDETSVNPRETYITSVNFTPQERQKMDLLTVSPDYQPLYILNTAFGGDKQPLMGWSSWNANRVNINEALIKETADSLVSLGLKNYGYNWVNIDDGFFNGRDENGNLQVNAKFPGGMRAVSDYIHAKGLHAGIYSEIGQHTCASIYDNDEGGKNSGLFGHEEQDLRLFFDTWNYDFIKVDYCGASRQGLNEQTTYTNVGNLINSLETELGRNLRYNICRWSFPGTWAREVADSWRISGDIGDNFASIHSIIELNTYLAPYCSPGKYNDMDMLQLGRGLNYEEEKTHFGMWAIMSSPLVIGCNLAGIRQSSLNILKNAAIIAVNQDTLGLQAEIVARKGNTMVFTKPIEKAHGKVRAVALYNAGNTEKTIRVQFKDIQLGSKARVRDLWTHTDLGEFTEYYEANVPAHGTAMLRIEGDSATDKLRYQGEYAFMNKFAAINLAGNARFVKNNDCITSGGYVMGWLGNSPDNWAEYRDVYLAKGGKYTFRLYYLTGENRNLSVFVNGTEYKMQNLNSGGFSIRATREIEIELNSGSNVIRLANDNGWSPDIDKFELIPEGGSIDADDFDIQDTSGQFPTVSSTDNSDETWYHVQFKSSEGVLQDMGENGFLLTKALDETSLSQQWKVVRAANPSGDYQYQLISRDGRALTRVGVSETPDGFYRTTSSTADWVKFRITPTNNNDLKPAWEMERQGANNRRLNQYNPTQSTSYDKNISEWKADDQGNPLVFLPATVGTAVKTLRNGANAKILIDGKRLSVEGNDIQDVRLYTVNGCLVARKVGALFSFLLNTQGCYLAVIKYKNNIAETMKVII